MMATIKFIGAKTHGKRNGYYSDANGFTGGDDQVFCLKGRSEYVIECDDLELLSILKNLDTNEFIQKFSTITAYLDSHHIKWEIEGKPAKL